MSFRRFIAAQAAFWWAGARARLPVGADVERWLTALEESSHAITGSHFGMRVQSATIEPRGDTLGEVVFSRGLWPDDQMLMVYLAGRIAAERLSDDWAIVNVPAKVDTDLHEAQRYAERIAASNGRRSSEVLDKARAGATALVDANQFIIKDLAAELLERGTMSGREVRAVIARSEDDHYGPAARAAVVGEHPKGKPSQPARQPARWAVARTTFKTTYDGRREQITAGVTGMSADHPIVKANPERFALTQGHQAKARTRG